MYLQRDYDDSDFTIDRLRMALNIPDLLNDEESSSSVGYAERMAMRDVVSDVGLCIIMFVRHANTNGPYKLASLDPENFTGATLLMLEELRLSSLELPPVRIPSR